MGINHNENKIAKSITEPKHNSQILSERILFFRIKGYSFRKKQPQKTKRLITANKKRQAIPLVVYFFQIYTFLPSVYM